MLRWSGTMAGERNVSLFTREWIEIAGARHKKRCMRRSPSLRGSGLKCFLKPPFANFPAVSLFTREWIEMSSLVVSADCIVRVSLFTREWIEMSSSAFFAAIVTVSLFTREWIEIPYYQDFYCGTSSPSLRGSGLK